MNILTFHNSWWWYKSLEYSVFPTSEECSIFLPLFKDHTCITKCSLVHCAWEIPALELLWVIHSYDPRTMVFLGYSKMNSWELATWGEISYEELRDCFKKYQGTPKPMIPVYEPFANGPIMIKDMPFFGKYLSDTLPDAPL
jgi:hypothetical protein